VTFAVIICNSFKNTCFDFFLLLNINAFAYEEIIQLSDIINILSHYISWDFNLFTKESDCIFLLSF